MIKTETAILAGGCFWGMQDLLRKIDGVINTQVGYTGGTLDNPKYQDIITGLTGHAEAIEIEFDPAVISYEKILAWFFKIHDPTTANRQGNDIGTQYRSAVFVKNEFQRNTALNVIAAAEASGVFPSAIVTEVAPAATFWVAEAGHQDYLQNYPNGYSCHYVRPEWKVA